MKCSTEQLSALLDGDLSGRARAKREAHLTSCARCQAELADLRALKWALRGEAAMPISGAEPPADFAALSTRLEPRRPPVSRARAWVWAPAFALAMVLVARLGYVRLHRSESATPSDEQLIREAESEFRAADREYQGAIDKLHRVTDRARLGWTEERRARYDAAQAALDDAIAKCQVAARSHPGDPEAEELLFAAYQKEISGMENALLLPGQRP